MILKIQFIKERLKIETLLSQEHEIPPDDIKCIKRTITSLYRHYCFYYLCPIFSSTIVRAGKNVEVAVTLQKDVKRECTSNFSILAEVHLLKSLMFSISDLCSLFRLHNHPIEQDHRIS